MKNYDFKSLKWRDKIQRKVAMRPEDFVALHRPALEADEVRHNLLLAILDRLEAENPPPLRWWPLGPAGAAAAQTLGFPIVLGELNEAQCHAFAETTRELDYPGVVGPDRTALWFAERAMQLGLRFAEPIPQQIHALHEPPRYPGVPGFARTVQTADEALFADWMGAFTREAVPHDPPPDPARLDGLIRNGRFQFWIVDGAPVSMAGTVRRTRQTAAIASVYTPPALRGRGYAGSVTAAVVERIFADGKTAACLYLDLRNPFSSRCYAKIGFKPVCESWLIPRAQSVN
jgi:RimJ/RimL family protein N-acetyltransferase